MSRFCTQMEFLHQVMLLKILFKTVGPSHLVPMDLQPFQLQIKLQLAPDLSANLEDSKFILQQCIISIHQLELVVSQTVLLSLDIPLLQHVSKQSAILLALMFLLILVKAVQENVQLVLILVHVNHAVKVIFSLEQPAQNVQVGNMPHHLPQLLALVFFENLFFLISNRLSKAL